MSLFTVAITIGMVGKVLLGIAVLRVHGHIIKEHQIDFAVIKMMEKERLVSITAVTFIIIGYVLEIISYSEFFGV